MKWKEGGWALVKIFYLFVRVRVTLGPYTQCVFVTTLALAPPMSVVVY